MPATTSSKCPLSVPQKTLLRALQCAEKRLGGASPCAEGRVLHICPAKDGGKPFLGMERSPMCSIGSALARRGLVEMAPSMFQESPLVGPMPPGLGFVYRLTALGRAADVPPCSYSNCPPAEILEVGRHAHAKKKSVPCS